MCNTGLISDIQRFSLGDGDGIRTTVFMQGCNLLCPWCHNPETINNNGSLLLYKNLCVSCGGCKNACPENIIDIKDNCEIADRNKCILCGKCENACLNNAIKLSGKRMTVDEVFGVIMQDAEFYAKSSGGVTLSGGEPLLQIDFCVELAKKCFENNISVVVDTAGDVPLDIFERIIPFTDCFYFDLKSIIEDYEKINANGGRIYDNLARLSAVCKTVARIPVIPGFNDSDEIMESFAGFLSGINIHEAHFLPFHRLGSGKYRALGLKYTFEDYIPESDDYMEHFVKIFTDKKIEIVLRRD